jgi:hypothetical protein
MLREVEAMTEGEAQKQLAGESALISTGDEYESFSETWLLTSAGAAGDPG